MPVKSEAPSQDSVIEFLRSRDYKYIKQLGQGGCGKTVLLRDDVIDQSFVCKKYAPSDSGQKEDLYANFINEIKLMHNVLHPNIVRVFSYFLYPSQLAGFILMEHIDGETIDKYLKASPESFLGVLRQVLDAFAHLEKRGILHRDIRPQNILVGNDGVVKVIDLGFGKKIEGVGDFDKSITLNWAFAPPKEFGVGKYDFTTEVYFVGKLFEAIALDVGLDDPETGALLRKMCAANPTHRITSFGAALMMVDQVRLSMPEFDGQAVETYRQFADEVSSGITKIDANAGYVTDPGKVISKLESVFSSSMLEYTISADRVGVCFVDGAFYYSREQPVTVGNLKAFLSLLKRSHVDEQRIILANLFGRLNSITRYNSAIDDEIPF